MVWRRNLSRIGTYNQRSFMHHLYMAVRDGTFCWSADQLQDVTDGEISVLAMRFVGGSERHDGDCQDAVRRFTPDEDPGWVACGDCGNPVPGEEDFPDAIRSMELLARVGADHRPPLPLARVGTLREWSTIEPDASDEYARDRRALVDFLVIQLPRWCRPRFIEYAMPRV